MTVIDYQNTEEVTLNIASQNEGSNTSNVPWVNSPSIDASISLVNVPPAGSADIVWRSTDIVWSATDSDTVARTSWAIKLSDWTSYSIDAGNTGNITAINYIYYDWTSTLKKTITPQNAVWAGKIMVCVAKNSTSPTLAQFQAFGTLWQNVFITADNIAANTITTNQLAANSIDGMTITGATVKTASSWQRVQLDSSFLRVFDSSGNVCWTVYWDSITVSLWTLKSLLLWWWDMVFIDWDTIIALSSPITQVTWTLFAWSKLQIPVWTNLY